MKVKELIEQLQKYDSDMEVVDYSGDKILSVHKKTIVDSDYPYEYKDHVAICLDCDEIAYCDWTIIEEIQKFLGEEGMKYFKEEQKSPLTDTVMDFDAKYYWEGRQIRNHIIDKFPKILTWLQDYCTFEDCMYKWTKKAVEDE